MLGKNPYYTIHIPTPPRNNIQAYVRAKCKTQKHKSIKRKYIPGAGDAFLRKIQN